MSIELISILLFSSIFLLLVMGVPIAFAVGSVSALFAILFWGPDRLVILASSGYSQLISLNLIAVPLFVFMGWIFENAGIADDMFGAVHIWLGKLPGGLAIGSVLICTIFAAMVGSLAAAIFTLAAVALPAMYRRGYDKQLIIGSTAAGSLLGLIIPPSISIIIYSTQVGESVGKLYLGCMIPGLLLSGLYMLYIGIICKLNPKLGPPVTLETNIDWRARLASLRSIVLPLALIFFILGGIYSGAISPLEASAVGATGSLLIAAIYRRLTRKTVEDACHRTLSITSFIALLIVAVGCFTSIYGGLGAQKMALSVAKSMPGGRWGAIIMMEICLLLAGMIMDDIAVILIFAPIFVPIVKSLGFSTLWFGVLYMINIQLAFLTPPYGVALFLMKAAVPEEIGVTMLDIYRAVVPFILLQLLCLVIVMVFPTLATFLPDLIIRPH